MTSGSSCEPLTSGRYRRAARDELVMRLPGTGPRHGDMPIELVNRQNSEVARSKAETALAQVMQSCERELSEKEFKHIRNG